jgi:Ca2+-binding RTX toxin-like protein
VTTPPVTTPPVTISGTTGNDFLYGKSDVNDVIDGKAGNDTLYGRSGDDTVLGGSGADMLFGEGGNDRLDGGTGNDWLIGGAGKDVFVFARSAGQDSVLDFTAGQDKIDLSAFGLGGMNQLAASASVVSTGTSSMSIDFGAGDRLTIYGLGKLTQDNVIF